MLDDGNETANKSRSPHSQAAEGKKPTVWVSTEASTADPNSILPIHLAPAPVMVLEVISSP